MKIPFARDTLQKLSLIAFAQAILIIMGDTREVVNFYSTEMIIPTFRKRLMDGVVELNDGTLMNIEFQTGNIAEKFLLRCAQYAITLRIVSRRLVETNILSTGIREKSRMEVLISNLFPFKPKIFFYSEYDGSEKLICIKDKIENKEKLTLLDRYYLVFIPLMGNVDPVKAAFEVFHIANNCELFTPDEQSEIKKCQFVMADIIADGDEELLDEFLRLIRMNNNFFEKYERELVEKNTKEVTDKVTKEVTDRVTEEVTDRVTEEVTDRVTRGIASNLKNVISDNQIAEYTGLSLEVVRQL